MGAAELRHQAFVVNGDDLSLVVNAAYVHCEGTDPECSIMVFVRCEAELKTSQTCAYACYAKRSVFDALRARQHWQLEWAQQFEVLTIIAGSVSCTLKRRQDDDDT